MSDGKYIVALPDVAIEVRNDQDPYTVFTASDQTDQVDLSIFFWLSMGCLLAAFVLILFLGVYYHFYISVS